MSLVFESEFPRKHAVPKSVRKHSFMKAAAKPPKQAADTVLGYGRVSREGQDLAQQRAALRAAGCTRLFEEKASGGRWDRPELHRLLDHLRAGDMVVVWKLDRLSRSLKDVLHIMERIGEAGAGFRSLTENIDTTTPCRPDDDADGRRLRRVRARHDPGAHLRPAWPPPGRRAASAAGARSWTPPSGARSPRRSSQVGRPQHRWRGCSACRRPPCRVSLPLMWQRVRNRAARHRLLGGWM